jgi:hypothetical protein
MRSSANKGRWSEVRQVDYSTYMYLGTPHKEEAAAGLSRTLSQWAVGCGQQAADRQEDGQTVVLCCGTCCEVPGWAFAQGRP